MNYENPQQPSGPAHNDELTNYTNQHLGHEIVEVRKRMKLTQAGLASLAGINQSEISRIEKGKVNGNYKSINAIVEAMEHKITLMANDASSTLTKFAPSAKKSNTHDEKQDVAIWTVELTFGPNTSQEAKEIMKDLGQFAADHEAYDSSAKLYSKPVALIDDKHQSSLN